MAFYFLPMTETLTIPNRLVYSTRSPYEKNCSLRIPCQLLPFCHFPLCLHKFVREVQGTPKIHGSKMMKNLAVFLVPFGWIMTSTVTATLAPTFAPTPAPTESPAVSPISRTEGGDIAKSMTRSTHQCTSWVCPYRFVTSSECQESFNRSTRTAAGSFLFDKWQTPKSCNNLEDFCFKTGEGVFNTVGVPAGTVESLKVLSTCGGGVEGRCDDLDLCSALCGYCYEFTAENGLCQCKAKLLSPEKAMKKVYDVLGVPTKKSNPCGPKWTGVTCDETTEEGTVTQIDLSSKYSSAFPCQHCPPLPWSFVHMSLTITWFWRVFVSLPH